MAGRVRPVGPLRASLLSMPDAAGARPAPPLAGHHRPERAAAAEGRRASRSSTIDSTVRTPMHFTLMQARVGRLVVGDDGRFRRVSRARAGARRQRPAPRVAVLLHPQGRRRHRPGVSGDTRRQPDEPADSKCPKAPEERAARGEAANRAGRPAVWRHCIGRGRGAPPLRNLAPAQRVDGAIRWWTV